MSQHKFCFANISGVTFCISNRILRRHPYTKLASVFDQHNPTYNPTAGVDYQSAVFFDRNPVLFCSILDFYRTGQLHIPHSFCFSAIQEELEFWRIDVAHLADCCSIVREEHKKNIKEIKEVQQVFGDHEIQTTPKDQAVSVPTVSHFRHRLSLLFNNTGMKNDWVNSLYFGIYLICVVLHLISYIVQADYRIVAITPGAPSTCPDLILGSFSNRNNFSRNATDQNITTTTPTDKLPQYMIDFMQLKYSKYFITRPALSLRAIDFFCTLLFIVDIILRALAVRKFKHFARNIGNWVDITCTSANILAFAISLRSVDGLTYFNCSLDLLTSYLMLEIFRVFRLARLLQFANKYNGIIVLLLTVRNSLYELGLLLAALGSGVVFFGFLCYIAELGNDSSRITSFPVGFWWAVVTMTTLGYGDVYPATVFGYIIGSCTAISGVIFMAVQVPVIGNKFNAFYQYACEKSAEKR